MKKFVVTGATGFIGRFLVDNLIESGHTVVAPLRKESKNSLSHGAQRVDIDNLEELVNEFRGCHGVFHLATLFKGNHQPSDIREMIEANVTALAVVCEAACIAQVPSFVYTESATQHVNGDEYSPFTLYAATKQAGTDILKYYSRRGLQTVCISLFDTIGPGDTRGKLISLLEKTAAEEGVLQMSPGLQLVDYLYVDDVISGLKRAMDIAGDSDLGSPYYARLSSMNPVPLRNFVKTVERTLGKKIHVEWGAREYREGEMFEPWAWPPVLDGWSPKVTLEEGIRLSLRR